jgi:hypothetical protein
VASPPQGVGFGHAATAAAPRRPRGIKLEVLMLNTFDAGGRVPIVGSRGHKTGHLQYGLPLLAETSQCLTAGGLQEELDALHAVLKQDACAAVAHPRPSGRWKNW